MNIFFKNQIKNNEPKRILSILSDKMKEYFLDPSTYFPPSSQPISYSQFSQDLNVLRFFDYKTNGFFVELGAGDGQDLSNTLLLEKNYGWRGILIEPNPKHLQSLQTLRKNSAISSGLCFSEPGKIVEFTFADHLSGISYNITKYTDILSNGNSTKMITTTLTQIFDDLHAPPLIDYLSLDTEGSELDILQGVDFNRYNFLYITIEHNDLEPQRSMLRQFLESKGYRWYQKNSVDDDYVFAGAEFFCTHCR